MLFIKQFSSPSLYTNKITWSNVKISTNYWNWMKIKIKKLVRKKYKIWSINLVFSFQTNPNKTSPYVSLRKKNNLKVVNDKKNIFLFCSFHYEKTIRRYAEKEIVCLEILNNDISRFWNSNNKKSSNHFKTIITYINTTHIIYIY